MSACRTIHTLVAVAAVLALAAPSAARAADEIAAASAGGGAVDIVWVPEDGNWPAGGWRLDRVTDAGAVTIAGEVGPGRDRDALAGLDPAAASGIAEFASKLAAGTLSDEEQAAADTVLVVAAITNVAYGRALGLRFRDASAPAGETTYALTALDARGASLRVAESGPVDPAVATPLPHAPESVSVDVGGDGLVISWAEPPNIAAAEIVGYRVVRVTADAATDLTPDLMLRTTPGLGEDRPERLSFLDREPVGDRASAYDVSSVDLFGRASSPKRVEVTLGDLARALAPGGLAVAAGVESAAVSWSPVAAPGVGGYVVERSLFIGGPYEVVTPDGLPPDAGRYDSTGLRPGTAYYFRVRIYDGDGNLGRPTLPAKAVPLAAAPPAAPANLAADAGPTRVALTWDEPDGAIAGYFVYRRLDGESEWKRLNGTITPEPLYYDRFERGVFSQARLTYRVQAIGADNQEGAFSDEVTVGLGDTVLPPPPTITDASGERGVATLAFSPGAPEADSDGFVVIRGDDELAPGEVAGDPLDATARTFADDDVTPGAAYWYEVVALDAAGNRSDPSNRVVVAVAAPDFPAPPQPQATYHGEPFAYVALTLPQPPDKALVVVEAREGSDGKWFVVAGPIGAFATINLTNLPAGATTIDYRIVYEAVNGARSQPSEAVTVEVR